MFFWLGGFGPNLCKVDTSLSVAMGHLRPIWTDKMNSWGKNWSFKWNLLKTTHSTVSKTTFKHRTRTQTLLSNFETGQHPTKKSMQTRKYPNKTPPTLETAQSMRTAPEVCHMRTTRTPETKTSHDTTNSTTDSSIKQHSCRHWVNTAGRDRCNLLQKVQVALILTSLPHPFLRSLALPLNST